MQTKIVSIAEAQRLGREYFDLDFPCTLTAFKSAFRLAAKACHPDTSGAGSGALFAEMRSAFNKILAFAQVVPGFLAETTEGGETGSVPTGFLTTVDGTLLAELGLGLGPTKNGSDCPECHHMGYTETFGRAYVVCNDCDENGRVRILQRKCPVCNGTGSRGWPKTFSTYRCILCYGTGYDQRFTTCARCRGTKTIWSKEEGTVYRKCGRCDGSGELPMFNPVIIKGALSR